MLCFGDVPAAIAKFTQKMNCVKYFDKLLNICLQILKNVITQGKITGLERSSYRIIYSHDEHGLQILNDAQFVSLAFS